MGTYHSGYLEGQLLVATPNITGSSFKQSVILICAHSGEGAMGLIINHTLDSVHYDELFTQLNISRANLRQELPIHYGGPVEINRGFVVFEHKGRFLDEAMITVGDIAISGSLNLLRNIAEGTGPEKRLLALGYAVPVDNAIVFDNNNMNKWQRAALTHGIDLNKFSTTAGHA
jgi:putative transcriptional regulator